jgi:putative SOS response-associated peptidase YedK
MCGRYASSRRPEDLVEEFEVQQVDVREKLEPDYNVAPTKSVYAVLSRPPSGDRSAAPVRRLRALTWGLVPSWAKDPSIGNRMINARAETVAEKPAFRRAFAARRCLLPADGYYEWYTSEAQTARGGAQGGQKRGRPRKQPFFLRPADGSVLAMAGLYEIWRDPALPRDDNGAFRWTRTIITTTAEDSLGRIHDRMPMLVEPKDYAAWLDPRRSEPSDLAALGGLLVPASPGRLEAYPVSTAVNHVDNNGAELVEPLVAEPDLLHDLEL